MHPRTACKHHRKRRIIFCADMCSLAVAFFCNPNCSSLRTANIGFAWLHWKERGKGGVEGKEGSGRENVMFQTVGLGAACVYIAEPWAGTCVTVGLRGKQGLHRPLHVVEKDGNRKSEYKNIKKSVRVCNLLSCAIH